MKNLYICALLVLLTGCSVLPPFTAFDDRVTLIRDKEVKGIQNAKVDLTFTNSMNHSLVEAEKQTDFPESYSCYFDVEEKGTITQHYIVSACGKSYSFYRVGKGKYLVPRNVKCYLESPC